MEGTSGLANFVADRFCDQDQRATVQLLSFLGLLLPVFLPIFEKVYDGIIVNIIVNCCRKKFNLQTFISSMMILALAIPTFIAQLMGAKFAFNPVALSRSVKPLVAEIKKSMGMGKQKTRKRTANYSRKPTFMRKPAYTRKSAEGDAVDPTTAAGLALVVTQAQQHDKPQRSTKDLLDDEGEDGGDGRDRGGE